MIKVKWTVIVSDDEVLTRIGDERKLLKVVKKRETSWFKHILRRNCLQPRTIEGKEEEETLEWLMSETEVAIFR